MAPRLPSDVLKYPSFYYTSYGIGHADVWTDAELRAEYTRLRDIAQKRLARLKTSEFKGSKIVTRNAAGFPKLRTLTTHSALAQELSKLASFVSSQYSTVSEQRRIMLQSEATLRENFGDIIPADFDLASFGSFMDYLRAAGVLPKNRSIDVGSKKYVALYARMQGLNLNLAAMATEFQFWEQYEEKLRDYVYIEGVQAMHTSEYFAKRLGIEDEYASFRKTEAGQHAEELRKNARRSKQKKSSRNKARRG